MSKHNALDMFGRSGNPTLGDATFADFENLDQKTMTLQGTVNKVGILLALVVLSAAYTWSINANWAFWRHDFCPYHHL
jgi:uncharacterized YccA/Bax inhibitor family protein